MAIIIMIKRIIIYFTDKVQNSLRAALIQINNPSCNIYSGVQMDSSSKLGKYVVLFKNTGIFNSTIGDYSFVQKQTMINKADIGKFCSIAMNVLVGPGQHPLDFVSTHPSFYSASQPVAKTFSDKEYFDPFKRTTIGNDVWIGHNAVVMDGIKIGNGAIIAAGAVVTRDVPDYAIVAGVPARIIRYRFQHEVIANLLKSQWWDNSDEWLAKSYLDLLNYEVFIEKHVE